MAELPRIRTPWKQQWRRIRYQLLPVVSMGCCVLLTGWLWSRRVATVGLIGEAHVKTRNIVSPIAGKLVSIPSKSSDWNLFDSVDRGSPLARLDDEPAKRTLVLLTHELTRLRQELEARQEELRQAEQDRQQLAGAEVRRLVMEADAMKLQVLDRRAAIEARRLELQRHNSVYEATKLLLDRAAISQRELLEVQYQKDAASQRLKDDELALLQAQAQYEAASKRVKELPAPQVVQTEKILAPLHTRIVEQEQKLAEVKAVIASLTLVSPCPGQISAVHHHPGESVNANEVIMTVTDERIHHIISYVRQDQRIRPARNMSVQIRSRNDKGQMVVVDSEVEEVGPQYAPIPAHHSRMKDTKAAEWGLPILIRMPPALADLRPGELVEVTLRPVKNGL